MPRLSKLLEKIEDLAANRWGSWYERNKARVPLYAVLGGLGWYFYGMLLNSLRLGKESVFHMTGEKVESIWVLNPFKNFFVVLTPFGLGTTAVIVLLICLLTRKGYKWFSGYEAALEFVSTVSDELAELMSQLGGKKGALNTLEKLEQTQEAAAQRLTELLEKYDAAHPDDPSLNRDVIKAANEAESKRRQVEAVTKLIDNSAMQSKEAVGGIVRHALSAASEKAEEVQSIIGAWSNEPGNLQRTPENKALLERVRASDILRDIAKYLGRFREIFAQGKRNGYTHGRGEKYSLELGSDLSRALTSELAMLAAPETLPLFLRKYQRRQIKQYLRREPIYKGAGAMICCLDESGSTAGECAAWGKAVALTLLDIAESEGRKFALIHFSGPGRFQTDRFLPKQATVEDKLRAAETFLDGGTDFCTPMNEALRLMQEEGFDNADIVFITDGECLLPEEYISNLQKEQSVRRFTITGILLDQGNAGMDFSLKPFCQNIYRTSELTGEAIVRELVNGRV